MPSKPSYWHNGSQVRQVPETDGTVSEQVDAALLAWDATAGTYVKVLADHTTGALITSGGGGGGGGAVTIADGADVAQGTTTDLATANTVVGILKAIKAAVQGTLTTARNWTLSSATDSVNVGNFPATQPVSGSVSVSNFPATQPVSGTVTANQGTANATPWNVNVAQAGGVSVAATAKGTQGTNFLPTQDAKDSGRTQIVLFLDAVAGITTEALGTMSITKGGVAQTAATSYTVTAGKTLRITGLHTSVKNTSTVASDSRVRIRQAASALSVSSPIICLNEAGSPAAIANSVGTDDTILPDGHEVAGGQQIGISHIESATTCTVTAVVTGYEY